MSAVLVAGLVMMTAAVIGAFVEAVWVGVVWWRRRRQGVLTIDPKQDRP